MRIIQREIGQLRHALIFKQTVTDGPALAGMVERQRSQQEGPMATDVGGAVAADGGEILVLALEVRPGQHGSVPSDPFGEMAAMPGTAVGVPESGIDAAEAE